MAAHVPARVEVDGGFAGGALGGAGVVGVVGEGGGDTAFGDAAGHIETGVGQRATVATGHVAVGVINVSSIDGASGGSDGVRFGAIAVGADIGFAGDVADAVIRIGFGRGAADAGEAVQCVVAEGFGGVLDGIVTRLEVAKVIKRVVKVLHVVGGTGADGGNRATGDVVAAGGDEAVAEGFLQQVAFGVAGVGLPVDKASRVGDGGKVTAGVILGVHGKASTVGSRSRSEGCRWACGFIGSNCRSWPRNDISISGRGFNRSWRKS